MDIRKRALPIIGLICGLAALLPAQTYQKSGVRQQYFPPRAFADQYSDGSFLSAWYSSQLQAMGEPSLSIGTIGKDAVTYRFTWLRTFHHPIAARVVLMSDGTGTLRAKVTDGAGGYSPGKLIMNVSFTLTAGQVQHILFLIQEMHFWQSPTIDPNEHRGCDGSEWILEGRNQAVYHALARWTPQNGPLRELGLYLVFDIAKLDIPKPDIY